MNLFLINTKYSCTDRYLNSEYNVIFRNLTYNASDTLILLCLANEACIITVVINLYEFHCNFSIYSQDKLFVVHIIRQ